MKKAAEIYEGTDPWSWYDYEPMINEFGNQLINVTDNEYQGDTRVLLEKDGKYGYLIFGWGSCSGCDALQGCDSIEEVQELMDSFSNNIKWFDSLHELQCYFREKDWELEWSWYSDETKKFIEQVLNYRT